MLAKFIASVFCLLLVLHTSQLIAQIPEHPEAKKALAKIMLAQDFGDALKFHSRQVITIKKNDRVPGLNGLMFVKWKGKDANGNGTEVMASVQWFEKKKDLLDFYSDSTTDSHKLTELDGTKMWTLADSGYLWTDGEHFLVSLGGSPSPPPEMVKAWLELIPSKVAEVEEEEEESEQ